MHLAVAVSVSNEVLPTALSLNPQKLLFALGTLAVLLSITFELPHR